MWLPCLYVLSICISLGYASPTTVASPNKLNSLSNEAAVPEFDVDLTKGCAKGPEYWCQNAVTAKACRAVKHCVQTVWNTRKLDKDESTYCTSCIKYIESAKDVIGKNVTIDQAKILLESVCKLAEYLIARECIYVVDKTLPEIREFIQSIDPHSFCATILICNSAKVNKNYLATRGVKIDTALETAPTVVQQNPETAVAPKKDDDLASCRNCFTLFTTGMHMFKSSSRDDVLKKMLRICGELSSFSDACTSSVITYFDAIYEKLDSLTAGDTCHLSGTCDRLYHFHESQNPELQTAIALAPHEPNDETCDFCVSMVKHLRDMLISNSTEDEFHTVLDGVCKQIMKPYTEECKQIVDQYYGLIYGFLLTELNGPEICAEIGICKSKLPLAPLLPVNLNSPLIGTDEANAEALKPALHRVKLTGTQTAVNNPQKVLLGANRCTWGPGYWCKNMETSRECKTVKHCIKTWESTVLPVDNGDICNICKDMVKQARDQLQSNETQTELKEVFEGSCKLIPVKLARNECIKVVDDFVPELVDTLSSQMNPQIVCATVGLCNSAKMDLLYEQGKKEEMASAAVEKVAPLPIERMFPVIPTAVNVEAAKRGKEACEICELFLHYVQQQITLPASEDQIKKVVAGICLKMKSPISTQCSSFVEVYGDAFISLLAQTIDPSQVCPSIGACPAVLIDNVKPTCPLCMLAVESLENGLENNKTEANIRTELHKLCSHLGPNLKPDCDRFVNTFTEKLVDAILADFSREEICAYLKLCSSSVLSEDVEIIEPHHQKSVPEITSGHVESHKQSSVPETTSGNVATNEVAVITDSEDKVVQDKQSCVLCEFVLSKLDEELKDKKTAEEIKHEIHVVCNHMPKSVRDDCNKFVIQYADLVLQLLATSMDPEQVCSELKLCEPHQVTAAVLKSDFPKCLVCEALMGALQGIAEDPVLERDLNMKLILGCNRLPANMHEMCHDIVVQLAPQLEDILREIPVGVLVCRKANICPKYRHNPQVTKSDDCLKGPAFWCSSSSNAASCGISAIELCQQHVWKGNKPMNTKKDY